MEYLIIACCKVLPVMQVAVTAERNHLEKVQIDVIQQLLSQGLQRCDKNKFAESVQDVANSERVQLQAFGSVHFISSI